MNLRFDGDGSRLVFVELEWRKEVYFLNCFNVPSRMNAYSSLREGLDAHDTRQHRRPVNPMIIEKWLRRWIERRLHSQAAVDAHSGDVANHGSMSHELVTGSCQACGVQATGRVPLIRHYAETLADYDLSTRATQRQFATNQRNAGLRRQHVDAGKLHHLGDR